MRAAVFDRYGPPDVLRIAELPDPEPGPDEVLIRVHAAGVQPFDTAVRNGTMRWVKATFPQQIGQEYSGTVERTGANVVNINPGDEVLGSTMLNAVAELLTVKSDNVVIKPKNRDHNTAAALVAASQTASGALQELNLTENDTILIHAAAGSVGTIATQLAIQLGARVIGTASPNNHDYLRELNATPVPYGKNLIEAIQSLTSTPTVALDAAGGDSIAQSVALGIPRNRIGTIVDDKAAAEHGALVVRAGRSPQRLAEVIAKNIIMPITTYHFDDEGIVEAHRKVESRHGRGKVVITVATR